MSDGAYTNATGIAVVGGTNAPVVDVKPQYFPVATKGSECAALVSTLSWADSNLTNYDFLQLDASTYFVTGVLNSSQTQANDPFNSTDAPGILSGCCWLSDYKSGVNPF